MNEFDNVYFLYVSLKLIEKNNSSDKFHTESTLYDRYSLTMCGLLWIKFTSKILLTNSTKKILLNYDVWKSYHIYYN